MELAATGVAQFISLSFLAPWNMPQSTMNRTSPVSTRYFDPVTVPAAPRK